MVLDSERDIISHRVFSDIPELLKPGDLLVLNDTRVFSARLIGHKERTGGEVELFLLNHVDNGAWDALSRPARRLKSGAQIVFGEGILHADVINTGTDGHVTVRLQSNLPVDEAIDRVGVTPLPPYIRREPDSHDSERYQTVYARVRGAVAAPTAGLHFTRTLLNKLAKKGIENTPVTLHVGIGTFRPLSEQEAEKNHLHREYCIVPDETVRKVRTCRERGSRVIAVGTTTVRALESASSGGKTVPFTGWTDIFIKPPYAFTAVDSLITNFHLPRSSLLMLVSAFAGRERLLEAYNIAIREKYRFYSYGDAMLILGGQR